MSGLEGAMKGQFEGRMISTSRRQPLGRTSSRPVRISPHLARNHSSTAHWPKHSRARLDEYPASIGQQKGHKSSCLLSSSLYCLWFDLCVSFLLPFLQCMYNVHAFLPSLQHPIYANTLLMGNVDHAPSLVL